MGILGYLNPVPESRNLMVYQHSAFRFQAGTVKCGSRNLNAET